MKLYHAGLFLVLCAAGAPNASAQAFDPAEYVRTLYRYDLGREPHKGEVELWTNNLYRGMKADEVRAAFLGCEEFFKICDRDLTTYLNRVSLRVYSRPATQEELRAWSNRLVSLAGNRAALCLELIRQPAPPPPPPPVVVVARPTLPAEPVPIATANFEAVCLAESAAAMVEVFVAEISRCGDAATVGTLIADARRLKADLMTLRRIGAEGATRADLRVQLRTTNDDWTVVRDRRHALNLAIATLRLPAMDDANAAIERLGQAIRAE